MHNGNGARQIVIAAVSCLSTTAGVKGQQLNVPPFDHSRIYRSVNSNYGSDAAYSVGQEDIVGPNNRFWRLFMWFNLATLPSNADVQSVSIDYNGLVVVQGDPDGECHHIDFAVINLTRSQWLDLALANRWNPAVVALSQQPTPWCNVTSFCGAGSEFDLVNINGAQNFAEGHNEIGIVLRFAPQFAPDPLPPPPGDTTSCFPVSYPSDKFRLDNGYDIDCIEGTTDDDWFLQLTNVVLHVTYCMPSTWYRDADGDGYGNPNITTQACAQPSGYVGNDDDCNDNCGSCYPGGVEVCDGLNNDCDGQIDEGNIGLIWYGDADGDGYGNPNITTQACAQPLGYVGNDTDCSDSCFSCHPGGLEICDGLDNDCDGQTDEGNIGLTWYRDADGDGYGNASVQAQACSQPPGYVANDDDCNDACASCHPDGIELCDGVDNDCDGQTDDGDVCDEPDSDEDGDPDDSDCDDGDSSIYHGAAEECDLQDNDCDGQIDEGGVCDEPDSDADGDPDESDCNDTDPSIHRDAEEACDDAADNDCDGQTDEDCASPTWYRDEDLDGYGNSEENTQSPQQPPGYASLSGDCDDTDPDLNPGAAEECDSFDNNCSGQIDEGCPQWHLDADEDGYGDGNVAAQGPNAPPGYVADDRDCNDACAACHPGATETCDDKDNDCDGAADEGLNCPPLPTWYRDADGDGDGDANVAIEAVDQPLGYVGDNSDCDDTCEACHYGASEVCDERDNNCDGRADEDQVCDLTPTWYRDADGDGHGTADSTMEAIAQPAGFVRSNTDCDDGDRTIHVGADEICNDGADNDCDGRVDCNDAYCAAAESCAEDPGRDAPVASRRAVGPCGACGSIGMIAPLVLMSGMFGMRWVPRSRWAVARS